MYKDIMSNEYCELSLNNERLTYKMTFSKEKLHLIFVKKGVLFIVLNNKKLVLTASYVFCFNGHEEVVFVNNHDAEVIKISFFPSVINSLFTIENIQNIPSGFSKTDMLDCFWLHPFIERTDSFLGQIEFGFKKAYRINILLQYIIHLENYTLDQDFLFRSALLEILLIVRKQYSDNAILNDCNIERLNDSVILEDVIAYFDSCYGEDIRISYVTKKFNTNRTTLSQEFKKILGISPIDYLNRLRITKAAYLLQGSCMNVTQIMIKTGFNNRNYFNKVFKKQIGCKPSEFRSYYDKTL